jgi:hypothetical protein
VAESKWDEPLERETEGGKEHLVAAVGGIGSHREAISRKAGTAGFGVHHAN